jgi:hypothetical protein
MNQLVTDTVEKLSAIYRKPDNFTFFSWHDDLAHGHS